jgi:hypothetical protein
MIGVTLILACSCIAYQEAMVFLLQRDIAEKVR